ncbi:MAG: hypothetical protein ACRCXN_13015 [Bacteroidales bacterium]
MDTNEFEPFFVNPRATRLPDFHNLANEKKEPMFHNFFWLYNVAEVKKGVYRAYRFELFSNDMGQKRSSYLYQ